MELKECPFCGRASQIEDHSYPCPTEGCVLNGFAVEPEHFELWNRRPIEEKLQKMNIQQAKEIKLLIEKLIREKNKWKIQLN